MKKKLSLLVAMVMALSLCACGGSETKSSAPASSGAEQVEEAAYSAENPIVMKLATQHPTDHMAHASAEKIKKDIEEGTEGRIKIDIYPAQQLGDYMQIYEEVMRGTIEMAHISGNESYDPRSFANFLPYIASGYEDIEKAFGPDSYLSQQFDEIQAGLGVKFLGFYCEGLIGLGSKVPLTDPLVLGAEKGALIRIAPMEVWKETMSAFGYRTSSIPYSDTYTSMQTGVVDGCIVGPANLNYLSFRDVINHYYQINVACESTQYLMNKELFDSLLPEDQAVIEEAFAASSRQAFVDCEAEEEKYIEMLKEEGIEVYTYSEEELADVAEQMREIVWPKMYESYTEELVGGLQEALAE